MNADLSQQVRQLAVYAVVALIVRSCYKSSVSRPRQRYDTFGPRFWTGWVDAFILAPVTLLASALLLLNPPRLLVAAIVVVRQLGWLGYTVVMHARYGQTVGKMVTRVRVVDYQTEDKISWRQAWLREGIPAVIGFTLVSREVATILARRGTVGTVAVVPTPVDWLVALPIAWFLAEVLTMLTNRKRRALHDFIAGTVVVRTNIREPFLPRSAVVSRRPVTPAAVQQRPSPRAMPPTPAAPPAFSVQEGRISFRCRWCQETVSVGVGHAGRLFSCPHCDLLVAVPVLPS